MNKYIKFAALLCALSPISGISAMDLATPYSNQAYDIIDSLIEAGDVETLSEFLAVNQVTIESHPNNFLMQALTLDNVELFILLLSYSSQGPDCLFEGRNLLEWAQWFGSNTIKDFLINDLGMYRPLPPTPGKRKAPPVPPRNDLKPVAPSRSKNAPLPPSRSDLAHKPAAPVENPLISADALRATILKKSPAPTPPVRANQPFLDSIANATLKKAPAAPVAQPAEPSQKGLWQTMNVAEVEGEFERVNRALIKSILADRIDGSYSAQTKQLQTDVAYLRARWRELAPDEEVAY